VSLPRCSGLAAGRISVQQLHHEVDQLLRYIEKLKGCYREEPDRQVAEQAEALIEAGKFDEIGAFCALHPPYLLVREGKRGRWFLPNTCGYLAEEEKEVLAAQPKLASIPNRPIERANVLMPL
jgi:hypothetical protein